MRDTAPLVEKFCDLLRAECPAVLTVAIGGSGSVGQLDDQSDLDLVVLCEDTQLLKFSQALRSLVDPLFTIEGTISSGPTWKEGFGCRTTYIQPDGFKIEFFVNSRDTVPITPRVLRWTPVFGADVLSGIQADIREQINRHRIIAKAQFDAAYSHLSICRHLARKELFAARHVLTSYLATALALHLFAAGRDYDPSVSYKRIMRDGLDGEDWALVIARCSANINTSEDIRAALFQLSELVVARIEAMSWDSTELLERHRRMLRIMASANEWLES